MRSRFRLYLGAGFGFSLDPCNRFLISLSTRNRFGISFGLCSDGCLLLGLRYFCFPSCSVWLLPSGGRAAPRCTISTMLQARASASSVDWNNLLSA